MGSLLGRRLVIVTGKGGTGKTTVSAALALAAAKSGLKVLVTEVGREEHLVPLLEPGGRPVGYAGRELATGLTALRIDPYEALAEYLGLQLGVRAIAERVLRNKAFRQLTDASPGWRELITLGKIWHLEQMKEPDGTPLYDLVVVDAPATGHGLSFLEVPGVVVSAIRAGPLRKHAGWVEEMVEDPERTLLLPVALAEELPARETIELVERARRELTIAVDRVVVNALVGAPFPAELSDLDELLAGVPGEAPLAGLPSPAVMARCAHHLRARHELNQRYVVEISEGSGLPVVPLPFLPEGVAGAAGLEKLAGPLLATPLPAEQRPETQ